MPDYLPTDGRRKDGFIPFPRALVQSEIKTASSRV